MGCDIAVSGGTLRARSSSAHWCACPGQRWVRGLWDRSPAAAAIIRRDSFSRHRSTTPAVCLSAQPTPATSPTFFGKGPAVNPGGRQLAACQCAFSGTLAMLNIIVSSLSWNCNLHKHRRQNPHLKKKCFRRFLTIVSCWGVIS